MGQIVALLYCHIDESPHWLIVTLTNCHVDESSNWLIVVAPWLVVWAIELHRSVTKWLLRHPVRICFQFELFFAPPSLASSGKVKTTSSLASLSRWVWLSGLLVLLNEFWVQCCTAVAQFVERPSKVSVWYNSTDVTWVRIPAPQHEVVGK